VALPLAARRRQVHAFCPGASTWTAGASGASGAAGGGAAQRYRRQSFFRAAAIEPAHCKSYVIRGVGQGSFVRMQTDTGHEIQTDVPKPMGGTDRAPQPVETLLAALLGCTQATALYVGRHMTPRVLIKSMEFEVTAHRDNRGAVQLPIEDPPPTSPKLQLITGKVRVIPRGNNELSSAQLDTLKEQTEARCPVASMLIESGCEIDVEWVAGEDGVIG